jgi:hypothetical protein
MADVCTTTFPDMKKDVRLHRDISKEYNLAAETFAGYFIPPPSPSAACKIENFVDFCL